MGTVPRRLARMIPYIFNLGMPLVTTRAPEGTHMASPVADETKGENKSGLQDKMTIPSNQETSERPKTPEHPETTGQHEIPEKRQGQTTEVQQESMSCRAPSLLLIFCYVSYIVTICFSMNLGLDTASTFFNSLRDLEQTHLYMIDDIFLREQALYHRIESLQGQHLNNVSMERYEDCLIRGLSFAQDYFVGLDFTEYSEIEDQTVVWIEESCSKLQLSTPAPQIRESTDCTQFSCQAKKLLNGIFPSPRKATISMWNRLKKKPESQFQPIEAGFHSTNTTNASAELSLGFEIDCGEASKCRLVRGGRFQNALNRATVSKEQVDEAEHNVEKLTSRLLTISKSKFAIEAFIFLLMLLYIWTYFTVWVIDGMAARSSHDFLSNDAILLIAGNLGIRLLYWIVGFYLNEYRKESDMPIHASTSGLMVCFAFWFRQEIETVFIFCGELKLFWAQIFNCIADPSRNRAEENNDTDKGPLTNGYNVDNGNCMVAEKRRTTNELQSSSTAHAHTIPKRSEEGNMEKKKALHNPVTKERYPGTESPYRTILHIPPRPDVGALKKILFKSPPSDTKGNAQKQKESNPSSGQEGPQIHMAQENEYDVINRADANRRIRFRVGDIHILEPDIAQPRSYSRSPAQGPGIPNPVVPVGQRQPIEKSRANEYRSLNKYRTLKLQDETLEDWEALKPEYDNTEEKTNDGEAQGNAQPATIEANPSEEEWSEENDDYEQARKNAPPEEEKRSEDNDDYDQALENAPQYDFEEFSTNDDFQYAIAGYDFRKIDSTQTCDVCFRQKKNGEYVPCPRCKVAESRSSVCYYKLLDEELGIWSLLAA